MHFPLPASLPDSARPLLIAAVSGRALAAAARRAGYRPLVADFFCDTDTVALADRTTMLPGNLREGIDDSRLLDALHRLAGRERPVAVVLGSGFERKTEAVDAVARAFPLAGNSAAAIRRVKDPLRLAADCAELGIPHPELRLDAPADAGNWIVKTVGGAGGTHIGKASGKAATPDRYFQRLISGRSVSALFIGDGQAARIVGFSRQWTAPTRDAPYRYGGAVRLRRFDRKQAAMIGEWIDGLTRRAGLVGLCSADLIFGAEGYTLLEINPRPGATLDIFDGRDAPLMQAHLDAATQRPYRLPRFADCMAATITYTERPVARFPEIAWPEWTADHQSAGTRLVPGDPVCTVFARGASAYAAQRAVEARAGEMQRHWETASA